MFAGEAVRPAVLLDLAEDDPVQIREVPVQIDSMQVGTPQGPVVLTGFLQLKR